MKWFHWLVVAGWAAIFAGAAAIAQIGAPTFVQHDHEVKAVTSAVASLPTCNAGTQGTIRHVTNALLPVALTTVAGGGAVRVIVFCNGSNWIVL